VDFWSSIKVLVRRWYIVVIGLVITLGAVLAVNTLISPSYTASGSAVLSVPPNLPEKAASSNPYLAYGNLAVAAKVVASAMNQPSVVREMKAKGATGTFVVDLDPERSSPIIIVSSQAETSADAIRTVEVVIQGVQQLLADRQKGLGAPQNTWLTAASVVTPEEANKAVGSRLRAMSAVGVLGLLGTLTLAFAIEGWAQGRKRDANRVGEAARTALALSTPLNPSAPPPPQPPPPAAVGMCPLCHAPFVTAEALADHLAVDHNLAGLSPAPRSSSGDGVVAARPRARRAAVEPPAGPAPRATRPKKSPPPQG
jgi:hypothetical protein